MPRPRKPHLHRQVSRHGAVVWYYRNGHGLRIRLRGAYDSPEFLAAYDAAAEGKRLEPKRETGAKGTLKWLIVQYQRSGPWAAFKSFGNWFRTVCNRAGARTAQLMGFGKLARGGRRSRARRPRSSMRSSAGREQRWPRSTPRPPTASGSPRERWASWKRTKQRHPIPPPHSKVRERGQ